MSSITFSIVQTDLYWEDKDSNLHMLEEKINNIQQKTEVVILPEMFTTGFSMKPELFAEDIEGKTVQWMKRVSAQKRIILTGSLMMQEKDFYVNRLIWMLPNSQMGFYDKRHLFAFADEHAHYLPGKKRLVASVKGWKILLLVCYDLRFPVWSRQAPGHFKEKQDLEYDIVVYVANWPEKRSHMWKTLLQARAIENQCYCIGVNRVGTDGNNIRYSGDSMVINPLGEVIYQKEDQEDIFTFTLEKDELESIRDKMPFWKDADPFIIIPD